MPNVLRSAILGGIAAVAPLFCGAGAQAGDVLIYDFASPYLQRMDGIAPGAGNAKESNAAIQMVDPWPPYVRNRHISANADRMIDAYERYRDVSKLPCAPPPLGPVKIETNVLSSGANGGAAGTGGTNCLSTSSPSPSNSGNGGGTPGK